MFNHIFELQYKLVTHPFCVCDTDDHLRNICEFINFVSLNFVYQTKSNFYFCDYQVRRSGYARRAGIRVNDRIVQINDTPADPLTLREAQLLIRQSGKQVKIYVKG